ncbi:hypothetical protein AC249_AIPGENE21104 [Exaiptasia diaphana]|nr:hypothetical protein AC249_AIPGENE21104 [Exaiptasia diaphana]
MEFHAWITLLFLYLTIPCVKAINTDYSTLEALCIAILVLFIIWVIVIIILICICKQYINKAATISSDDDCFGENRRKSSPRVAPENTSRPEMKDKACQTEPE